MSGIVGLLNLDGEPIDPNLLGRMTDFMAFRGPDDRQVWIEGNVGFGHTMLRTTWEAEYEQQPFTLDRQVWIVADARIDDRENLAEKLAIPFQPLRDAGSLNEAGLVTDVEFILQAYLKWGAACVEHLLGDFAFAIWDGRKQRLFCARDQFGIKLFYYSRVGNCLIISNTLNCSRQHPQVSSDVNDAAIGDFLLFGQNYNLETSAFADIQKLAPGHTLCCTNNTIKTQRYWTLPIPELIRYKNSQDYVDRFKEVMGQAVGDRLRTEKVSITFSGGLDSTTVAATALDVAKQSSQHLDLQALTVCYDRLIPDEERYYSGIAAQSLEIPIHYLVADDYQLFAGWEEFKFRVPEPGLDALVMLGVEQIKQLALHSRVVLSGNAGDEVLADATVAQLMKCTSPLTLFLDIKNCLLEHSLRPSWGSGLLSQTRDWRNRKSDRFCVPSWIDADFLTRCNLLERWNQIEESQNELPTVPCASAHRRMKRWIGAFQDFSSPMPEDFMNPLEHRYPFLDLRLIDYIFAIPPLPWRINKQLLRIAMHGKLPEKITQRPKTPLAKDPVATRYWNSPQVENYLTAVPELRYFVDIQNYQNQNPINLSTYGCWEDLRVLSLGHWLYRMTD